MLTEKDWAVLENCTPYEKSKLLAEQSAWEFVKSLPGTYDYTDYSGMIMHVIGISYVDRVMYSSITMLFFTR